MAVALFMDQHIPRAITLGLRRRHVDVLTAYEDGSDRLDDTRLVDRATTLGRPLVTNDEDLLVEAARRQREGIGFAGLIYLRLLRLSIGRAIRELEIIARAGEPGEMRNQVIYLPF